MRVLITGIARLRRARTSPAHLLRRAAHEVIGTASASDPAPTAAGVERSTTSTCATAPLVARRRRRASRPTRSSTWPALVARRRVVAADARLLRGQRRWAPRTCSRRRRAAARGASSPRAPRSTAWCPEAEQPIARGAADRPAHALRADQGRGRAAGAGAGGAVVARSFNLIGPGQAPRLRPARPSPRSSPRSSAASASRCCAVGNLTARRDFVHVDDGAEALRGCWSSSGEPGERLQPGERPGPLDRRGARPAHRASPGVAVEVEEDPARLRPVDIPLLCGDASRLRASAGGRAARSTTRSPTSGRGARRVDAGRRHEDPGHRRHRLPRPAHWSPRWRRGTSCALLVRPSAVARALPGDVEFAAGDVTDRASLDRAAQRAATRSSTPRRWSRSSRPAAEFDRINVGGLENVLAAAEATPASAQVVYVSSFIALGPDRERVRTACSTRARRRRATAPGSTTTSAPRRSPTAGPAPRSPPGAPLAVVYPGVIYGPGELTEGNIVVRHILDLVARQAAGAPRQAGAALELRLRRRRRRRRRARRSRARPPGRRYVLGGENVTQGEFYRLVGELDRRPGSRSAAMPDGVAKARRRRR